MNTFIQHVAASCSVTDLSAVKDTEEKNNVSLCHKLSLTAAVDVALKWETYVTVGCHWNKSWTNENLKGSRYAKSNFQCSDVMQWHYSIITVATYWQAWQNTITGCFSDRESQWEWKMCRCLTAKNTLTLQVKLKEHSPFKDLKKLKSLVAFRIMDVSVYKINFHKTKHI